MKFVIYLRMLMEIINYLLYDLLSSKFILLLLGQEEVQQMLQLVSNLFFFNIRYNKNLE